jgi:hypothetical protein
VKPVAIIIGNTWNPADYAWIAPLFDLAFPGLFYG